MRLAAVLLVLLLAGPAAAQDDPPPDTAEEAAEASPTGPDRSGWNATRWLTEFYDHKYDPEPKGLKELLERAAAAPGMTPTLAQRISAEVGYLAKKEGRWADAVIGFQGAAGGPADKISSAASAELPLMQERAGEQDDDDAPDATAPARPAGSSDADAPSRTTSKDSPSPARSEQSPTPKTSDETAAAKASARAASAHPGWTANQWLAEFYRKKKAGEKDQLRGLLEEAERAPDMTRKDAQAIAGESALVAKDEGRLQDAYDAFERALDGPNADIIATAEAGMKYLLPLLPGENEEEEEASAPTETADPAPTETADPAPTEAADATLDHPTWNAARWLTEFYTVQATAGVTELRALLEGAAKASGMTPLRAQQIAGETGFIAERDLRFADAAQAFKAASEGPDPDLAGTAAKQLPVALDKLLKEGREQRDARLFDEADATFVLAGEIGADPGVVKLERETVAERKQQIADGTYTPEALGPSWGKPPDPSEALSDPIPPPLVEEPWLDEFRAEKDAGVEPEDLGMILDDLEDEEDYAQRIAIERGYLGLDDGDPLAAGRAFKGALEGDDTGLSLRAEAELLKLQRHFRTLAVQNTHLGDIARADTAYRTAEALGADRQLMEYERAYIAGLDGDEEKVVELLAQASEGPNEAVGTQAAFELAARTGTAGGGPPESQAHISAFLEHRDAERWDEADDELDLAEEKGASSQVIDLYRGYLDKAQKNDFAARKHFQEAAQGEDEALAKQARAELRYTAKPLWADVYAEGFGWARLWPEARRFDDFTGLIRVRGYLHPFPKVAFDPYIFFQLSGDVRSRQESAPEFGGGPLIYADNSALLGGGLLLRVWKGRISFWGQVAAAFPWVKLDTAPAVDVDVQVGAAISFASEGCRPPDGAPAYVAALLCAEFYADTLVRNRPYPNIFFTARGRLGLHYLVTGPVAWSPLIELRHAVNTSDDLWANLIDVGLMHRWRLMAPIGVDVAVGVHGGSMYVVVGDDATPPNLGYVDLRLQISAYAAF